MLLLDRSSPIVRYKSTLSEGTAMLKDTISGFELYQPTDLDNVLALLDRFGGKSWILAGGGTTP